MPTNKVLTSSPTNTDLRSVLGCFPTGVTVITGQTDDGQPCGFTANSFVSLSMDPPLVAFSLRKASGLHTVFKKCQAFAINILSSSQEKVARKFATPCDDRFQSVEWHKGKKNDPLLKNCAAWIECESFQQIEAGDHTLFIGKIVNCEKGEQDSLIFKNSKFINSQ